MNASAISGFKPGVDCRAQMVTASGSRNEGFRPSGQGNEGRSQSARINALTPAGTAEYPAQAMAVSIVSFWLHP
jgi:hypothetical protein